MKLEKERNSTRISYLSKSSAGEVSEAFEAVSSKVEGIYLPSDVQKEKDGVIINIRHRESLKVYLEKNVFKIDDYIVLLKRIKKLYMELAEEGYDPGKCLWDVDAIFVGESLSDLEAVYPVLIDENAGEGSPLADLLAVTSLHVFDSRDTAIDALSDVVKQFSLWERGEAGCLLTNDLFDESIRRLSSFASGSGVIRQYASVLANKFKKYVSGPQVTKTEIRSGEKSAFKPKSKNESSGKASQNDITDPAEAQSTLFSLFNKASKLIKNEKDKENKKPGHIFVLYNDLPKRPRGNGRRGLEGRLINYEPPGAGKADVDLHKEKAKTDDIYRKILIDRVFAEDNFKEPCPYVSRRHASVVFAGDNHLLSDDGSANGTYLNGERITPGLFYKLKKGDSISLGHRNLTLRFDPSSLN